MKRVIALICLLVLSTVCFAQGSKTKIVVSKTDAVHAIDLGVKEISKRSFYSDNFKLIKVENLYYENPDLWFLTFKSAHLIPEGPSKKPIGMGGEIFVKVNLKTKECTITYGE